MGRFVKGDVVVAPFPFSDLSASKRRPALVVATLTGDDVVLRQITSKTVADPYAIAITNADFTTGSLPQSSNIRPNRLFTADANIIIYRAGILSQQKVQEVIKLIRQDKKKKHKSSSFLNTPAATPIDSSRPHKLAFATNCRFVNNARLCQSDQDAVQSMPVAVILSK